MLPISLPPREMMVDALLYAVLPALLSAAAILAAIERWLGAKQASAAAAVGLVVGVVLGISIRRASFDGLHLGPEQSLASALAISLRRALTLFLGDSTWNRLPWAALGLMCVGRVARLPDLRPIDGWLLRGAATLTAAWLVIPVKTQDETAWLMPAFALVVLAEWAVLETLAAHPPGGAVIFSVATAFFVASMVLIQAAWATKADLAIVLASALTGTAIVAAWRRVDASGGVPVAALLLPSLMLMGQQETQSEVPWQAFALCAGAPLMLAVSLPLCRWQSVWLRVLQLGLVLLPLGAAAVLTGPVEFE
jgi:hypothetical protein